MSKKVSYKKLLTEAIAEFDTSKTVEVKGPMLDPIISWDGGGELPTNKDAASVLERFYFKQDQDPGVSVLGEEAEKDSSKTTSYETPGAEVKGKSDEHAEGAGTEQAGTTEKGDFEKREDEIAKEWEDLDESDLTEAMEDAVIEKLIAEMEEEDEGEEGEEEEMEEQDEEKEEGEEEEMEELFDLDEEMKIMAGEEDWEGVKSSQEAPDEKEMKDPEEHAEGAGTEQAGTGDAEGEIPPRKDLHDKFVKPHNYAEAALQEEEDEAEAEGGEEEEEDLDVDKKMAEQLSGAGHVPPPSLQKKMKDEDQGEEIEEAFQIFREEMEEEEEEEGGEEEE